jgi:hypothetical protein
MVRCIAKKDGMLKGLKITNHTGQVLYYSTWIAGVDYDEDEFKDKDYDPDDDEDEDEDKDSDDINDSDDDDDDDDDNDKDMCNKMDPNAIAALSDPATLQDDEVIEESVDKQQPQVKEPDKEEESKEEL